MAEPERRMPDWIRADSQGGTSGATAGAHGGHSAIHVHGVRTEWVVLIALLSGLALAFSIATYVGDRDSTFRSEQRAAAHEAAIGQSLAAVRAEMQSRYEQSYRELSRETRLQTQATDDMRASLIARGINPHAHDVTDVGALSP